MQQNTGTYLDQHELPPELCAKPLPLVGLSGLDVVNNAVHKLIWDAFGGNRRIERSQINYKLVDNVQRFPVVKPKRNSYEWYVPKGILKRNWMSKHANEVPAVVALFHDLDRAEPMWNEKMIECASRVQSMRAAVEGRSTKIVIVLIQDTPPLPPGEDALSADRAVALCASCELNAKSLFVLPHGDHLQGYVVRLDSAFNELAQNYYHLEARNVKSHKEHLNKNTHQYLLVRHQFKMGFLNELRQDNHTAHKHYTHAYNNLMEIRIVDTNASEIRTVAGFVNYKLCKLMFALGLPRDAISQFRAHVERFKARVGFQELAFEHCAWLSKQYSTFGDIFDEAVKSGLPAVQTQHPGVYYQQAAQQAILRKNACKQLCSSVIAYPQPDPLSMAMEFYGQHPWLPSKLNSDVLDPQVETRGIQALQFLEKQANHSNIIISLYGLAIAQFKTYRCLRMRRHLVVQMAEEYYNAEDYGKALTLLSHMLWDYRSERWPSLLTDVLYKAHRCAYLTANIQDYVSLSLELLSTWTIIGDEKRKDVFQNLCKILRREVPTPEPNLPALGVERAGSMWNSVFAKEPPISLVIDMSNISSCVSSKARFTDDKYQGDQNISVEIFVKSTCPFNIKFTRVSVTINTPGYSSEFAVDEPQPENQSLTFSFNETKRYLITFEADPNDIGKEIQVGTVNLYLGNARGCYVNLKFNGVGGSADSGASLPELSHFRRTNGDLYDFDNIALRPAAYIVPRESLVAVTFDHPQPALAEEWYPIKMAVVNREMYSVKDVSAEIYVVEDGTSDISCELSKNNGEKPESQPIDLRLSILGVSAAWTADFWLRSSRPGSETLTIKIRYFLQSEKPIVSVSEHVLQIPVVRPFDVATKFASGMFGELSRFYVGEPFVAMPTISSTSPWPIVIESTQLESTSAVECLENSSGRMVKMALGSGDVAADTFLAAVKEASETPVEIGRYIISWRREAGTPASTQIALLGLPAEYVPLDVTLPLPAHGFVRTPLLVAYSFYNRSQHLLQLELTMGASEAFMFAGYKQLPVSVPPRSSKTVEYNLYPLIAGSVMLPKLTLGFADGEPSAEMQEQLNCLVERKIPTHLFIMPQAKCAAGREDSAAKARSAPLEQPCV